jgi:heat shock protein HslJ
MSKMCKPDISTLSKRTINYPLAFFLILALLLAPIFPAFQVASAEAATNKAIYTSARLAQLKDLQSLTFRSSSVTVNGKKYTLASKEPISIRFEGKSLSIKAGCNTLGGQYSISKGVVRAQSLFGTKMACTEKLMDQDVWLNQMISSRPTLQVQFLSPKSKVKGAATILTLNSRLTPALKSGQTVIKMNVYETYVYADTPLGDENSEALVKATCEKLIANKASESDAQFAAEQNALIFRVTSREGEDFAVTMDYRVNRMNVKILGGIVVECSQG